MCILCSFQVLLLVDASFGFEMETFEFLNILQAHGFPKVMGVLTHLDMFKNQKALKKIKKALKQRFWTEVQQVGSAYNNIVCYCIHAVLLLHPYTQVLQFIARTLPPICPQGAKVFYLSGLIHGQYPKVEVHNLGRFISVMKFRPLEFRTTHPYMLVDR